MDGQKTLVQAWLRYANSWLTEFNPSTLSDPARLLLEKLENRRKNGEIKQAWDLIHDLRRFSDKADVKESAEIRLFCGLAAAEMDDFRNSLKMLLEASQKYKDLGHHRAISQWMAGCAQWMLPNKEVDAINSWQSSLKIFKGLRDHFKNEARAYEWYKERCNEMHNALHVATEKYRIPDLPSGAEDLMGYSIDDMAPLQIMNEEPLELSSGITADRIGMFPVYKQIAAGQFSSSGILADSTGRLQCEQFLIDDIPHRVFNLMEGHIVNLPDTHQYFILKVFGNSMNKTKPIPIEDDDYVLMRYQSHASHGDIVAAEIVSGDDKDNRATIKRFVSNNGKIYLKPESNDSKYTKRMNPQDFFTKFDEGFHICGVAVAVFKKVES